VFVHEVIAAITTEPSRSVIPSVSTCASERSSAARQVVLGVGVRPSAMNSPISLAFGSGLACSWNAATNECHTSGSDTGPADASGRPSDGSIVPRIQLEHSLNVASGAPSTAEQALLLRVALGPVGGIAPAR
jgi:hypothetical protein